ncbi:hypothetical protein HMPREF9069_00458 [Atopobium sp. oral taxon 810 str. F0209]|nr:hypothetical protein HMPREF9069_00458 [Atopobium sp. oral taxon 810 str. F0209]
MALRQLSTLPYLGGSLVGKSVELVAGLASVVSRERREGA